MNMITTIQVEFDKSATPLQIPIGQGAIRATRQSGVAWVETRSERRHLAGNISSKRWSVEADVFIAKIREMLGRR